MQPKQEKSTRAAINFLSLFLNFIHTVHWESTTTGLHNNSISHFCIVVAIAHNDSKDKIKIV